MHLAPATLAPAFVATARTTALATSDSRHHALAPGVVRRIQDTGTSPASPLEVASSLTPPSVERPSRKNRGRSITAGHEMDLRMDPPYEEVVDSFFTWEKEAGKMGEMGEEEAGVEVPICATVMWPSPSAPPPTGSPSPDEVVADSFMNLEHAAWSTESSCSGPSSAPGSSSSPSSETAHDVAVLEAGVNLGQAEHETVQAGEGPYPQGLPLAEPAESDAAQAGPVSVWTPPAVLKLDPPLPAYEQFDKETREELRKGYKGMWLPLVPADAAQIAMDTSSEVGKRWNALGTEGRQQREAKYKEDVKKYLDECRDREVLPAERKVRGMPGNQDVKGPPVGKSKQHPSGAGKPYSYPTRNRQPGGAEDSVRRNGGFAEVAPPSEALIRMGFSPALAREAFASSSGADRLATAVQYCQDRQLAEDSATAGEADKVHGGFTEVAPPSATAGEADKVRAGCKAGARGASRPQATHGRLVSRDDPRNAGDGKKWCAKTRSMISK